jgi:hypothetical protein
VHPATATAASTAALIMAIVIFISDTPKPSCDRQRPAGK